MHKEVDKRALQNRPFRRIWILEKSFRHIENPSDRLLFSFEFKGDKKMVLRGGPWNFAKALVMLEDYDGVTPFNKVPLHDSL